MKKKKVVLLSLTIIFFAQCTTPKSHWQIFKLMQKEHDPKTWCFPEYGKIYVKSRKEIIDKLSKNAYDNDTIILIERIHCMPSPGYYCTVYESKNKKMKELQNDFYTEKFCEDNNGKDPILNMAIDNKLDEIKKRGEDASKRWTPSHILIVNILTKTKKDEFMIRTLKTSSF